MSSNITGTGNSITGNSTIRNNNTASNSSNSSNSTKVLILSDALLITPDPSIYGPYPYNGLQILAFAILAFFPALSLAVCGLRVHSRVLSKKKFTLDDYLIFIATILAVAQAIFSVFVIRSGYWGIHEWQLPAKIPDNVGAVWIYLNAVLYNPIFCLIKVAALVFLLRLGSTKTSVRWACYAMIAFNTLQVLTFLPLTIAQCLPVGSPWVTSTKDKVSSSRCIRRDAYAIAQSLVNILTDSLTLVIPFFLFADLRVNKRIRWALMAVFLLGILVTIMSGVRLYYMIRVYYLSPVDRKFSIGYVTSTVEINLAILTASVPALWPLARRWFPSVFSSLGIDAPYLEPDIEVAYATTGTGTGTTTTTTTTTTGVKSDIIKGNGIPGGGGVGKAKAKSSRKLTGKVHWRQRKGELPSYVDATDTTDFDLSTPGSTATTTTTTTTTTNNNASPVPPMGLATGTVPQIGTGTGTEPETGIARATHTEHGHGHGGNGESRNESNRTNSRSSSWFDNGDDKDDGHNNNNNNDNKGEENEGNNDEEEDDDISETASHEYHQHIKATAEAELRRSPSSEKPGRSGGIGIGVAK